MKTPEQWTPWESSFYELARASGDQAMAMLRSFSGADQADSEKHFEVRKCYVEIAALGPDVSAEQIEGVLAQADARWRAYAAEQEKKVKAAPKIKRGPASGHSTIGHRWVSPDAFQSNAIHVRTMVRIIRERLAPR